MFSSCFIRTVLLFNRNGVQSSSSDMNKLFHKALLDLLFEEQHDLFPPNICTPDDVTDRYDVSRSFWRRSESRAASWEVDSQRQLYCLQVEEEETRWAQPPISNYQPALH